MWFFCRVCACVHAHTCIRALISLSLQNLNVLFLYYNLGEVTKSVMIKIWISRYMTRILLLISLNYRLFVNCSVNWQPICGVFLKQWLSAKHSSNRGSCKRNCTSWTVHVQYQKSLTYMRFTKEDLIWEISHCSYYL